AAVRGGGQGVGDIGQCGVEQAGRPGGAVVMGGGERREGQVLAGPEPGQHRSAAGGCPHPDRRVCPPPGPRSLPPRGGVPSRHLPVAAGRTNSCQKLLCSAADPPMTATAHVPVAVTSEVARGGGRRGTAVPPGSRAAEPQPAASTVPASSRHTSLVR